MMKINRAKFFFHEAWAILFVRIFAEIMSAEEARDSAEDSSIVDLLQNKKRLLEMQLFELQATVLAAKKDVAPSDNAQAQLDRISSLQQQLQRTNSNAKLSDLIKHRLMTSMALTKILFPGPPEESGDLTPSQNKAEYLSLVDQQSTLSSAVLKIHQNLDSLKTELDQLQRDNLNLVQSNRQLMAELRREKDQQEVETTQNKDSPALARAQEKYDSSLAQLQVCRHMFQGLILGSGVDWAKDKKLRETVLRLGRPISDILTEKSSHK
ncbi:hypothetical protein CAPTEDRAFT_221234 [Capitella teleta]|uniref:Centromere protein H C-terminal domain-containing protein n=1 Tax=Capitella teleta TaxID=283909 RepID=R7T969_CAPTE|nr:hypothetical protein CAPTEDRAFT_221234 [Capitella teleta]|eukprot:ELT87539.1 hypothetical protein CAPTEDRAFT_221234 [Capitella teleta]